MANLTRAHKELFQRRDDECFESLAELANHCQNRRALSQDRWHPPSEIGTAPSGFELMFTAGGDGAEASYRMNSWSFGQLCKLASVGKETVNRLSPDTAQRVFSETLPGGRKPLQLFTQGETLRSLHGTGYTRLYDADIVGLLQEFAVDFEPPQKAFNGATGLYAGEQDVFCFLIDPAGWTEINGEAFAPGFFVWNSEVGRRSLGIETFWFQAVCQNHIVWDAVEVAQFTRKHTASVHESLGEIRRIIETLVEKRDERKDGFAKAIRHAMETVLGTDAEEVLKELTKHGIPRTAAKEALRIAEKKGRFTIFSLVDALTRLAGENRNAGERIEADQKAAGLLALAA
jgi:hypothetical protein